MWILILQIGTARSSQPADDVAEVHSWNRNHGAEMSVVRGFEQFGGLI